MTSQAPAADATKFLEKVDQTTHNREEFLEAVEKKLQRISDPVGWIKERIDRLQQISHKLEIKRQIDPHFENRLSENGRLGLHLIYKVVKSDLNTLTVTTDELNRMQICMTEIKSVFGEAAAAAAGHPPQQSPQQHANGVPTMTGHLPHHPVYIKPEPNNHLGAHPPSHAPPSSYAPPAPRTLPSAPEVAHPPAVAPTSSSTAPKLYANDPNFEDGIFGIIVIELQFLMKKCFEKPSKLTITTLTGRFVTFLFLSPSFVLILFFFRKIRCSSLVIKQLVVEKPKIFR
jgi:hypothetical protein